VGIQTAQPGPASLYARGGRLFVDADWTLRLGEIKPAGEWKRVPAETDRISVRPDGQVLASLHDGTSLELGWLRVVRLAAFRPIAQEGAVESTAAPQPVALTASESPLLAGHLEYGDIEHFAPAAQSGYLLTARQVLAEMLRALNQPNAAPKAAAASAGAGGPIVIHADLAWTEQHLKALGVPAERTPGHTVIPLDNDPQKVANALAKVLQVLRLRLAIHAQNLRNADRARDAENRLNPYRRKVIKIGPQGEAVEEADPSPFRKVYKPGDPDADADGNITLPNVNSALETTDFQAAAEEYKLVRACMERLAPQQIFPDPPPLPVKPDGR
jgi:flagellar basal-body rod protein FlgC